MPELLTAQGEGEEVHAHQSELQPPSFEGQCGDMLISFSDFSPTKGRSFISLFQQETQPPSRERRGHVGKLPLNHSFTIFLQCLPRVQRVWRTGALFSWLELS